MRKPPKAILPIIECAAQPETTVEDLLDMLRKSDKAQLKRNAFYVLQAIPHVDTPAGRLKFAAVHHVAGSDTSVFGMLASDCIVGSMGDEEACEVVIYMLKHGWLKPFPGSLFHACAHAKPKLAVALYAEGIRITHANWASFLYDMGADRIIQMAQLYLEITGPDRAELLAMRLAAKEGSPLLAFLDERLSLVVNHETSRSKH